MQTSLQIPVLYLPGASGRAKVWQPVASRLAKRRPAVLIDYPSPESVPAELAARGLEGLSEYILARAPKRFDLVALSMGCSLALHVALFRPERVRRIVLVTVAGGVDVVALGGLDFRHEFRVKRGLESNWMVADTSNFSERLGEVHHACLLVFGDRDLIAPPQIGQFLLEHLPHARLELIAGATHDLEEEFPDLLASLIEAHLRLSDLMRHE